MASAAHIRMLFLDIGGVLLTNGWDHHARARAAEQFQLDYDEVDQRHQMTFDVYELGKISLDEYLARVIFHHERSFSPEVFRDFMFSQSVAYPEMMDLVQQLRQRYQLRVGVVSNEGRELTNDRIHRFHLGKFVDFFVSSCFVHLRKPDEDIYRLALDIGQVDPQEVVYLEDRLMFVDVACRLGIRGVHHRSHDATREALAELGLEG